MSQAPQNNTQNAIFITAMPAVFVVLWSTGFVGAKFGLPYAEPGTFLALRFTIVAVLLIALILVTRAPWPSTPGQVMHIAVSGLLIQGLYLGGVFYSISLGVDAGVSALIAGIQPLLVAIVSGPLLKEKVSTRQWLGFCLGVMGVALVVWKKLDIGAGTGFGMALSVAALIGISMGTVYQKKFCADMDLRSGSAIQLIAAASAIWVLSFAFETQTINWTWEFIGALMWLCIVLSMGAFLLLFLLIRRGAASKVSSLFFLVPPCTAIISYFLFGETFGLVALIGMGITVSGVALVNFERKPAHG